MTPTSRNHTHPNSNVAWTEAMQYKRLYGATHALADLDQAIHALILSTEESLTIKNGTTDSTVRAFRLCELATALNIKYRKTGELRCLYDAITYMQASVDATASSNTAWPVRTQNLGRGLLVRYTRLGQVPDLSQAVNEFQRALDARRGCPDQATYEADVGAALYYRYKRTRNVHDLTSTIQPLKNAIKDESTPLEHRLSHQRDLGVALREIYHKYGNIQVLDEARGLFEAVLKSNPSDYRSLWDVGTVLADYWDDSGDFERLMQATKYFEYALKTSPARHAHRAAIQKCIGDVYADLYEKDRKLSSRSQCVEAYWACLTDPLAIPMARIKAGRSALFVLSKDKEWAQSVEIAEEILKVLPDIVPPLGGRDDLQTAAGSISGLGSIIASIYLQAKREPAEALLVLENYRGFISGHMLDARADMSELQSKEAALWEQYKGCQERISVLVEVSQTDHAASSDERRRLQDTLTQLRKTIRGCTGFERFLLGPNEVDIRNLARDGPLVALNCSYIGSEAFLITQTDIKAIDLPGLKVEDIQRIYGSTALQGVPAWRESSLSRSDEYSALRAKFTKRVEEYSTLEESDDEEDIAHASSGSSHLWFLWEHAVRPVLHALDLLDAQDPNAQLPHIWWVGGGLMASMPLHAAGKHTENSYDNAISYVVSSYVPTLKTLGSIQSQISSSLPISVGEQKLLIVSMPETPGHQPLNVKKEVSEITKQAELWAKPTFLDRPDKESVIRALATCTMAHFACHGSVDNFQPGNSALILGRSVQERLTLSDMDNIDHKGLQIAYLSACSTARLKFRMLADEAIHLANAFLMTGFPHIIATQWNVHDDSAVQIASEFYKALGRYDGSNVRVAQALHTAVLAYRNRGDNATNVDRWAPFIHLGG